MTSKVKEISNDMNFKRMSIKMTTFQSCPKPIQNTYSLRIPDSAVTPTLLADCPPPPTTTQASTTTATTLSTTTETTTTTKSSTTSETPTVTSTPSMDSTTPEAQTITEQTTDVTTDVTSGAKQSATGILSYRQQIYVHVYIGCLVFCSRDRIIASYDNWKLLICCNLLVSGCYMYVCFTMYTACYIRVSSFR